MGGGRAGESSAGSSYGLSLERQRAGVFSAPSILMSMRFVGNAASMRHYGGNTSRPSDAAREIHEGSPEIWPLISAA